MRQNNVRMPAGQILIEMICAGNTGFSPSREHLNILFHLKETETVKGESHRFSLINNEKGIKK